MIKNDKITAILRMLCCHGNGLNPEKEPSYMGNRSGESREQNRKDKVTRFPSVTYARQIENTSWKVLAYGIYARVVDVSEIERVSAANE